MTRLAGAFFFMILLTTMTPAQNPTIDYQLSMSEPWTHYFEVEVTFSGLPASEPSFELSMPAWRTGRYLILDFAGGVVNFTASDGNKKSLSWEKADKDTWRIAKGSSQSVKAIYKVYANEFSLRTRGLNDEGAFLDGASVFMYSEPHRNVPLTLTVVPYKNWHVTTGLDAVRGKRHTFSSPGYHHLADCPLFVGDQKDYEFEAEGKNHVLSILGEGNYDAEKMIKDIKKLITINKNFWGSIPYDRYVFMLHLWSAGSGGTEHVNSTIMGARPFAFTNPNSYRGFLGLVSHEYFHTWNVKQIRPAGISPYNWAKENYTRELWIAEGTTSYYDQLLMVRGGMTSVERFIDQLPRRIEGERRKPGNRVQSAAESSFDAWVKYWKGHENSYNAESDYYDKGYDISLMLDLEIRQRSKNKASLDDVMRAMYQRFPWDGNGYTLDDFQKLCGEFGGGSFRQFFDDFIFGTEPLEWETALSYAGFEVIAKEKTEPWVGLFTREQDGRTAVRFVIAGSPAYKAGVSIGDELIAFNGYRIRGTDLSARIAEMETGEKVRLTIIRNDRLREFDVTLETDPVSSYTVTRIEEPTSLQKEIYESWLGAKWEE